MNRFIKNTKFLNAKFLACTAAMNCALALTGTAQAQQAYAGASASGVTIGFAFETGASSSARLEYATLPQIERNKQTQDLLFNGDAASSRASIIADYFPFSENSARLSAGLTYSDTRLNLRARPQIGQINGQQVDLSNAQYDVKFKFPAVTPYLGIGFGHRVSASRSGRFDLYGDVGVNIGKFGVSSVTKGIVGLPSVNGSVISQTDIDAQNKRIQEEVAKQSVLPNVSVGVSYTF